VMTITEHKLRDDGHEMGRYQIIHGVPSLCVAQETPLLPVYDYLKERHGELPGTEKTLRNYIV
jgi:hypothetical protein